MPIKTITYKRIKNLGNYESKTLEATSVVNDGNNPELELKDLVAFVEGELFPSKNEQLLKTPASDSVQAYVETEAETLEIKKRRGELSSNNSKDVSDLPF